MKKVENLHGLKLQEDVITMLQPIFWRIEQGKYRELFIEENEQLVTGVGVSWSNSMHPTAKYINVSSIHEGDELLHSLLKEVKPFNKVVSYCYESNNASIQLLEKYGFQLFRKTYEVSYSIAEIVNKLSNIDEEIVTTPLVEIQKNDRLTEQLFRLLKLNYEQTHLHNEASDLPWQEWQKLLYEDNPHLQFSKIVVQEGQVVGYIFIHPISETVFEIGWVGKSIDFPLINVLKQQILELQAAGYTMVGFEIDTTDYFAYEFADFLQLGQKESWNSYMRKY
jgi:hypothetical protein